MRLAHKPLFLATLALLLAAPGPLCARKRRPSPTPSPTSTPTVVPSFPTFKGDNARSGYLPDGPQPPLRLKLSYSTGSKFYSSPAVVSGTVYLGCEDQRVYALSLTAGTLLWKSRMGERIFSSSPAVANGLVYICSVDGCLDALEAGTGKRAWRFCVPVPKMQRHVLSPPAAFSSPLVQDGLVYFGTDNHLVYCLDALTGAKKWEFATNGKIHDNSAAFADGRIYIASHDGYLYALGAADGSLAWKASSGQAVNTCPMIWNGMAFFGSGEQGIFGFSQEADGYLHAVRLGDGSEAWKFATRVGVVSSPAVDPAGKLVFGSADQKVYALDAATGTKLWSFATGSYVVASPLICGGTVYIGSMDGKFYALDMDGGKQRWSYNVPNGVFSSAAALDGSLLVAGLDGVLYCFDK